LRASPPGSRVSRRARRHRIHRQRWCDCRAMRVLPRRAGSSTPSHIPRSARPCSCPWRGWRHRQCSPNSSGKIAEEVDYAAQAARWGEGRSQSENPASGRFCTRLMLSTPPHIA
jgi:hypothetical protein